MLIFPNETVFSLRDTVRNYKSWVNERVNTVFRDPDGNIRKFMSPKRGNATYMNRVNRRFQMLREAIAGTAIRVSQYSRAFFITLTLDQKDLTIPEAWEFISHRWNNYITKLRRKFGKIDVIRCYEAQKNGYPHIHALCFTDFHSMFYLHRNYITGKKSYRTCDIGLLADLKSKWSYKKQSIGFVDVQMFINTDFALKYVLKYITKLNAADEDPLIKGHIPNVIHAASTNYALLWRFSKRAFSISQSFNDLIRERLHNSNRESDLNSSLALGLNVVSPLSALFSQKWEFLGIQVPSGFIPVAEFREKGKTRYKKLNFNRMIEIATYNKSYEKWRNFSKFFNSAWFINQ